VWKGELKLGLQWRNPFRCTRFLGVKNVWREKIKKFALERPKGEQKRVFGLKNPKKIAQLCRLYVKITFHSQNDMLHIGSDVVKAEIYVHIIW
jgi:hypothetical protein